MYGGVWGGTNLALVLGVGLFIAAAPEKAADLGGDCCTDLEERIAELESTTARKGNRKVSLTISGWVNEAIFAWDDGTEQNVYIGTNFIEQSRFRFLGEAKIDKDLSAGYIIEVGVQGHPSNQWNQAGPGSSSTNPVQTDYGMIVRKSNWFLKSKTYGQVAVGLNGTSTYHLLDDADPTLTRNVNDAEGAAIFMSQFQLRSNGAPVGTLRWTDALRGFNNSTPGDSGRRNVVRYDSPIYAGFTASVSWGEDDLWDTSLTYKGDVGDFTLVGRVGYGESTDPAASNCGGTAVEFKCRWGGAGATIQHKPTGLFVYGGWGQQSVESIPGTLDQESNVWFIQPGIEKKWFALGKTNVFAEYRHDDPGANPTKTLGGEFEFWQAGVIQNIEAADITLYLLYQHADGEVTLTGNTTPTQIDSFQEIITGAKINF